MSDPVCTHCNDTHQIVRTRPNGDEQTVMCTWCPTPCEECRSRIGAGPGRRGGGGPFCASTPCSCACHAGHYQYRLAAKVESVIPGVDERELRLILRRAGLTDEAHDVLGFAAMSEEDIRFTHGGKIWNVASVLRQAVHLLLVDAVREDRRWAERVKLVERRSEFAVSALRGGHDDEL